jgi:NAD(P)-dependent dehydrogenase (short-subunit alcohol dehydrogenase family)
MQTVLITGAKGGLGQEFIRQYLAQGCKVIAVARGISKNPELIQLLKENPQHLFLEECQLEDTANIEALAQRLSAHKQIDILINNAGLFGEEQKLGNIDYDEWLEVLRVNTIAPLKLTESLLPLMHGSTTKKIINITSKMGSIDDNQSGGYYIYRTSKAALNMLTKSLAEDLKNKGFTVLCLHPGWVQTNMGGQSAPTKATESVTGMLKVIEESSVKNTGQFIDYLGRSILW